MKIVNVTVVDDNGDEQVLDVNDGFALLACQESGEDRVLTQTTSNPAIMLQAARMVLNEQE
jgi:hypothetical protein